MIKTTNNKKGIEMTTKQIALWNVADKAIRTTGLSILRSPNAAIVGTREWALSEAYAGARGQMPDDETCQRLIDVIRRG